MLSRCVFLCILGVSLARDLSQYQGPFPEKPKNTVDDFRLLEFTDAKEYRWVEESLIDALSAGDFFIDITDYYEQNVRFEPQYTQKSMIPTTPTQQSLVNPRLPLLSTQFINSTLSHLQSYNNRYHTSSTGRTSALWIRDELQSIASASGRNDVSVELFDHSFTNQPSVIARIQGTSAPSEIIIIGAHIDSTAPGMPNGRAPGCDDDASGFVAAMDAFRVLVESGYQPKRTLEFHGFAAEEVGLRGSQDIAQTYAGRGTNVIAMWQSEMNGYVGRFRQIMVTRATDSDVDYNLTVFAQRLVDEYANIGWYAEPVNGQSDHMSFTRAGYRATCVAEAGPGPNVNPWIHSTGDTLDKMDITYVLEFNKVTLAFAIELGENA